MSSFTSAPALGRVAVLCVSVVVLLATTLAGHAAAGTTLAAPHVRVPRSIDATVRTVAGGESRGRYASTPLTLGVAGGGIMAFPPAKSAAARPMTVVYLHGAHGRAENGCPWFRSGASELGWLVCPEAIEPQPDGSWSWGADVFAQALVISRALEAAVKSGATGEPGVAVGFSQGSYVALDLVKAKLAKFRGLVLLGAELHPNAQTLRDAGVKRIALGAGLLDGSHASLVEEAQRLDGAGIETRFFELGEIGHTYAVSDPAVLRDAIAWAGGLPAGP